MRVSPLTMQGPRELKLSTGLVSGSSKAPSVPSPWYCQSSSPRMFPRLLCPRLHRVSTGTPHDTTHGGGTEHPPNRAVMGKGLYWPQKNSLSREPKLEYFGACYTNLTHAMAATATQFEAHGWPYKLPSFSPSTPLEDNKRKLPLRSSTWKNSKLIKATLD